MKKRGYLLLLLAVAASVELTACGAEQQKETVEATEYAQINEINNSVANAYTVEGFACTENDEEPEQKEAEADEETENREVKKNTDIYSKPEKKSSVVGSVKKGKKIAVFGILENSKWYKVVYSGRIAYMPADAIKEKEEERVVTENTTTDGTTTKTLESANGSQDGVQSTTDGTSSDNSNSNN